MDAKHPLILYYMNFTIKTIGCKVNTYESTKIKDKLISFGFNYIDVEEKERYRELDFYIVNTCSVTKIADKKSRQMLHLAKKYNKKVKVVAIGCLVDSLASDEGQSLDGVDYLLSNKEKDNLPELLLHIVHEDVSARENNNSDEPNANSLSERVRAFIKIQDGCNQYCTYCIIPYLRGNIKSRSDEDIIKEIADKAKRGVKEIVLTGIHLSSFGLDRQGLQYENDGAIDVARKSLLDVMMQISRIDGIERIRLGSLEPRIINDAFLKVIIGDEKLRDKFCANFCLSLQSGSDKTLKKMNRHYTTKDFEKACDIIRKHMPFATITTDVIVGFPGETEEDFKESLEFVKRMRFYNPNIFPYSRRKGTKADEMEGQLTNEEKHRRARIMIVECEKITKDIEDEYMKTIYKNGIDILVEEEVCENGKKYGLGYSKEYIKGKIPISFCLG